MSRWRHPVCFACWHDMNPDREPVRVTNDLPQECCFCSAPTAQGIYMRYDPALLNCQHD